MQAIHKTCKERLTVHSKLLCTFDCKCYLAFQTFQGFGLVVLRPNAHFHVVLVLLGGFGLVFVTLCATFSTRPNYQNGGIKEIIQKGQDAKGSSLSTAY